MCGICGIINFNNTAAEARFIRQMMRIMKHRGPDDEGLLIENNIGLGFVRLSIIDLSVNGHQPMTDPTGQFVIILNGEIYNYIELRQELVSKGYHFKSNSDTEVLLYSYIEWGKECLDKLNGMFAFSISGQAFHLNPVGVMAIQKTGVSGNLFLIVPTTSRNRSLTSSGDLSAAEPVISFAMKSTIALQGCG